MRLHQRFTDSAISSLKQKLPVCFTAKLLNFHRKHDMIYLYVFYTKQSKPKRKEEYFLTPVFIYTIISCAMFWFIYPLKARNGTANGYKPLELIPFYLVMRFVPVFMMKDRTTSNYIAMVIDLLLIAGICFGASAVSRSKSKAAAAYLFCPLPVICMASGSRAAVIINAAVTVLAVLFMIVTLKKHPKLPLSVYAGGYAFAGAGIHFCAYSMLVQNYRFSDLLNSGQYPVFMALGILLVLTGLVITAVKTAQAGKLTAERSERKETALPSYEPEKFGRKNIIHIAVITVLYAFAVLYQLGSHTVPSTNICFNSNDPDHAEIVLDLGEYVQTKKIEIFLGTESLSRINVSTYNEVTGQWEITAEDAELPTSFAWNSVDVSWTQRYIGIVFPSYDIHFNEIVILDSAGNTVTPVNAYEYPELFDEQDMYPGEESTYYYRMMFDEIYHGRTGYEFLHNLSIYETTHPPLGKTIIAGGIAVFGMNPFGWRIMVALFGTLMVPLMYIFAWKLSHRSGTALTGGVLLAAECMHFTLSRIATIDIIVALFILMMFFFMYCFIDEMNRDGRFSRQALWLVLSGISTGLAIATKWTGIYAAGGLAVLLFTFLIRHCISKGTFRENLPYLVRLCLVCVASFIVIPLAFYSLSYFEFVQTWPDKNIFQHAIENSQSMFSYHSAVFDSHPYASPWYDWLTDKQPLLDAVNTLEDNKISSVATFVNPLVAFGGLAALFHNIYLWRAKKNVQAQFLAVSYIAMLMPWLFIHRTVFIYQYFGCVLIMILLICNSLIHLGGNIKKKEYAVMAAAVIVFLIFFPETSGVPVYRQYTKHVLELVPTWIFE